MSKKGLTIIKLILFIPTMAVICLYRTAIASSFRGVLLLLIPIALVLDLILTFYLIEKVRGLAVRLLGGLLSALLLCSFILVEGDFRLRVREVRQAAPNDLSRLGQHFIVGFKDYAGRPCEKCRFGARSRRDKPRARSVLPVREDLRRRSNAEIAPKVLFHTVCELRELVELGGAIGGVYYGKRNVAGRTQEELKAEIEELQALRRERGELPLIICGDQEGGAISHLSPPLTRRPFMAELAGNDEELYRYGLEQGRELEELGVNLNFSPVVDLKVAPIEDSLLKRERLSQIYYRALSADPAQVSSGGLAYCRGLAASGVGATLKHFPGLGRAAADSHLTAPPISVDLETLENEDWRPFREIGSHSELPLAIMVGHCIVEALDREQPASLSPESYKILRDKWNFQGLIVTDDLSMYPISLSRGGVEEASRKALSNGADLILISGDPDLYYYAMSSLLRAQKRGELNDTLLKQSQERLTIFMLRLGKTELRKGGD